MTTCSIILGIILCVFAGPRPTPAESADILRANQYVLALPYEGYTPPLNADDATRASYIAAFNGQEQGPRVTYIAGRSTDGPFGPLASTYPAIYPYLGYNLYPPFSPLTLSYPYPMPYRMNPYRDPYRDYVRGPYRGYRGQAVTYLIRTEHLWWKPEAKGYTNDVLEAGLFTLEEATSHVHRKGDQLVPIIAVFDLIKQRSDEVNRLVPLLVEKTAALEAAVRAEQS